MNVHLEHSLGHQKYKPLVETPPKWKEMLWNYLNQVELLIILSRVLQNYICVPNMKKYYDLERTDKCRTLKKKHSKDWESGLVLKVLGQNVTL